MIALLVGMVACPLRPAWAQGGRPGLAHASDAVFDDVAVPDIHVEILPEYLDAILDPANQESDTEYPARFTFDSPALTASVDSVGFRLRGNTSRASQKKSFRISFNTFAKGRKFRGLEKLNINGEHNDPSIMRAKLSWDLFAELGVPASRSNHVRLFINGAYYGLMMNVEQVDEQFLQRWFGDDSGNLYKCLWPADLTVRGSTADAYRPQGSDRRPYDLQLGTSDTEGYDDLAHLIHILNTTSDAQFQTEIETVLDVNSVLRAHAVLVATGSWDSYWFLKNNFYLYHDPGSSRFVFVPFDMDNSFGIWWSGIHPGIDWAERDPYAWGHPTEPRPLMRRLLAVAEYRERFTFYLRRLVEGPYWQGLPDHVAERKVMTAAAAEADLVRTLDWGFTIDDYHASFTSALAANPGQEHVTWGLLPFISRRGSTLQGGLDPTEPGPILSDIRTEPKEPRQHESFEVFARVETAGSPALVEAEYWLDEPVRRSASMSPAPERGKDVYRASIPALGRAGTTDVRIHAVDAVGRETTSRLVRIGVSAYAPWLVINEVMALNESTIADEFGEFDDWAELYNPGSTDVSTGGLWLSDDAGDPFRWAMPDVSIPGGGYLLVWLDGQPEQGALHAPFRLAAEGEMLVLTSSPGMADLAERADFGPQPADRSWARTVDGGAAWSDADPTPGMPNGSATGIEGPPRGLSSTADAIVAWPNPAVDVVHLSAPDGPLRILDVLGRQVAILSVAGGRARWDRTDTGRHLSPGLYFALGAAGSRGMFLVR